MCRVIHKHKKSIAKTKKPSPITPDIHVQLPESISILPAQHPIRKHFSTSETLPNQHPPSTAHKAAEGTAAGDTAAAQAGRAAGAWRWHTAAGTAGAAPRA